MKDNTTGIKTLREKQRLAAERTMKTEFYKTTLGLDYLQVYGENHMLACSKEGDLHYIEDKDIYDKNKWRRLYNLKNHVSETTEKIYNTVEDDDVRNELLDGAPVRLVYIKARKVEGDSYGTHPAQIDVFGVEYCIDNSNSEVINVTEVTSVTDNTQTMMNNSLNTFYTNNNIPNERRINIQDMPTNGTEYEFVYLFGLTGSIRLFKANDWKAVNEGYLWYHDTVLRPNPVWKNTLKIDLIRVRHLNNPSNWEYTHPSQVLVYGTQYTNDGSNKNVIAEANPYGDKISQTLLDEALNSYYTTQKVSTSSTVQIQTSDMPNGGSSLPTYEWVIMTDVSGYTKRYTKAAWLDSGDNPYKNTSYKIWKSAEFVGYPQWGTFNTIKTAQIKLYTGHFEVFDDYSNHWEHSYIKSNATVVVKTNNLIMNINSIKTGILTSKSLSTAAAGNDSVTAIENGSGWAFVRGTAVTANNAAKTGGASYSNFLDGEVELVKAANKSISGASSNVFNKKGYVNPTLTDFYTSNSITATYQLPMTTPTLKTPIWSYSGSDKNHNFYCKYPNSLNTPMLRYTYNYNFPYNGSPTCTRTQNDNESLRYPNA